MKKMLWKSSFLPRVKELDEARLMKYLYLSGEKM
jgi:hypothetical protein